MAGFVKAFQEGFVLVDVLVKLQVHVLDGSAYQPVSDGFGYLVSDSPYNYRKIGVNSLPNLINENVLRIHLDLLLVLRDKIGPIAQIVDVIRETIPLLRVYNALYNVLALLLFYVDDPRGHVADLVNHAWEAEENPFNYLMGQGFQEAMDFVQCIQSRLLKPLDDRLKKIDEDVGAWETWDRIALMLLNSAFYVLVTVLLCSVEASREIT